HGGVPGRQPGHVGRVVGLHMGDHQVVGGLIAQRLLQRLHPCVGGAGVHRVHDGGLFVPDQVGIVADAAGHGVLALEQVDGGVVDADAQDGISDVGGIDVHGRQSFLLHALHFPFLSFNLWQGSYSRAPGASGCCAGPRSRAALYHTIFIGKKQYPFRPGWRGFLHRSAPSAAEGGRLARGGRPGAASSSSRVAALASSRDWTDRSLRLMARVRVPIRSSSSRSDWRSRSCSLASPLSNFSNSVLTAPSTCHTSLERFWMARVLKPICRLFSRAAMVLGPATLT